MKVYTYYEEVGFPDQKIILDIWRKNWANKGFQPIVLKRRHAESHFLFNKYANTLNKRHKLFLKRNINEYGLSCYFRWLAYANLNMKETFLVSDYDVINVSLKESNIVGFNFMCNLCPCLISGNSKDFLALSKFFIEYSHKIKKISNFHDQDILAHAGREYLLNYFKNLKISHTVGVPSRIEPFYSYPPNSSYHVSHRSANDSMTKSDIKNFLFGSLDGKNKRKNNTKTRIRIMEELSNIQI